MSNAARAAASRDTIGGVSEVKPGTKSVHAGRMIAQIQSYPWRQGTGNDFPWELIHDCPRSPSRVHSSTSQAFSCTDFVIRWGKLTSSPTDGSGEQCTRSRDVTPNR